MDLVADVMDSASKHHFNIKKIITMKNKVLKYLTIVLAFGITLNSCETVELDLADDPNALTPAQADPDFYLNSIQEDFARLVDALGEVGAEVTRIEYMNGRDYASVYGPTDFDNEWELAYQGVLINTRDMTTLAEEAGLTRHVGIGQFLSAYTYTLLVDNFGPVPFTEATNAPENLNPAASSGDEIYAGALALLDQAIVNFTNEAAAEPAIDFFYDNDYDQWVKAANTLKARLYINTGNIAAFNAIIDGGDYIIESEDDFQFQWGTNEVQPDTRHPDYAARYVSAGANDYASIWSMNLMMMNGDPRIRYYFYRQTTEVPGAAGVPPNEETLACSLTTPPAQYVAGNFPFCSLPNGYWGRNHGNNEGIPPDGFLRVAAGVYPTGGNYDDSRFEGIGIGSGGGGAGITPMLLASWVDFWQAEAAMLDNPASGKEFILDGIAKSIAKVQAFGALDGDADLSIAPDDSDIQGFIDSIEGDFDNGDDMDKWNIMAEQFFTALKGNGHDAFNFYRRTGFPTTVEPNVEPDPGAYIRSFIYPASHANNNSSVAQKTVVTEQVFWDTNPSSPAFPPAN